MCHTGMLTACEQDQDETAFHPDPVRKLSTNLYDIYHCCVYSEKLLMMDQNGTAFHPVPARKLSANLYDIYHCCVYSEKLLMMDTGTVRNMAEFHSKNKFEKLVHLFGFITRNRKQYTQQCKTRFFQRGFLQLSSRLFACL